VTGGDRKSKNSKFFLLWIVALLIGTATDAGANDNPRQRTRIDDGWRFALGHAWDAAQDRHGWLGRPLPLGAA